MFKVGAIVDDKAVSKMAQYEIDRLYLRHLSKGKLATGFSFKRLEYHADDFCRNLTTVRILYDVVKIPRIIKRLKSTK